MRECKTCKSVFLFGGKEFDGKRYCSNECLNEARRKAEESRVPEEDVDDFAQSMRQDVCPLCQKRRGIEVHKSYDVLSFIILTRSKTNVHLCCRTCALKKQTVDFLGTLLLGWWGFPWGLIMTPIQLIRNICAMAFPPGKNGPSAELRNMARLGLAQQRLENQETRSEADYQPMCAS